MVCSHPHNVSVTVFIRVIFNSLLVCFIFCHHTSSVNYTPCFCSPSIFRTKITDYLLLLYIFIMHYKFNTAVVLSNCNCRAYMCYNLFQSFKLWMLNSINNICAIVIIVINVIFENKQKDALFLYTSKLRGKLPQILLKWIFLFCLSY